MAKKPRKPLVSTTERAILITGTIFVISMIEGLVQYTFAEMKSEKTNCLEWLPQSQQLAVLVVAQFHLLRIGLEFAEANEYEVSSSESIYELW